jgi:hypothetical protein
VLPDPYAHSEMPPEFPLTGRDVLPVACVHCGFIAPFSKKHMQSD